MPPLEDNYFTEFHSKPALKELRQAGLSSGTSILSADDTRPDLLLGHTKLVRHNRMNANVGQLQHRVNQMFVDWVKMLFCGFNVVLTGGASKFSILETFRLVYLDSGRMPNYGAPDSGKNGVSLVEFKTVVLHGMEPVNMDLFHHGLMGVKERRKVTDKDYRSFVAEAKRANRHYCFLVHSFELFYKNCEPLLDVIVQLYAMDPQRVHIVMSSDCFNASKKLSLYRYKLRLLYYTAPYGEPFLEEKLHIEQLSPLDDGCPLLADNRMYADKIDLQAVKDIYLALGNASQVMVFVIEYFVQHENTKLDHLDFHEMFRLMQSSFAVRRAQVLRNYLKELMDHRVVDFDESKGRIRCTVPMGTCKKFLESLEELKQNAN